VLGLFGEIGKPEIPINPWNPNPKIKEKRGRAKRQRKITHRKEPRATGKEAPQQCRARSSRSPCASASRDMETKNITSTGRQRAPPPIHLTMARLPRGARTRRQEGRKGRHLHSHPHRRCKVAVVLLSLSEGGSGKKRRDGEGKRREAAAVVRVGRRRRSAGRGLFSSSRRLLCGRSQPPRDSKTEEGTGVSGELGLRERSVGSF
jgi:hypothetical protein